MSWLLTEDRGPIRRLTLNRPERKNAIPPQGWTDLRDAFVDFERSEARVLIVSGDGGDFCAGADLGPSLRGDLGSVAHRHERMRQVEQAATALHRTTKPTIAAVDGVAVGAGMNLAIGCDVVLASTRARFAQLFVLRGLAVDFGGTWLLPRLVGMQRAKELALSGRTVGAEEAVELGLAVEAVSPEDLNERALKMAEAFLAGAPVAQMLTKQSLDASFESSFAQLVGREGQSQAVTLGTEDAAEGIAAFLEKRQPRWRGR